MLELQYPVPGFGYPEEKIPFTRDTAGFTTFAQSVRNHPASAANYTDADGRRICDYDDADDQFYMPVTDGRNGALSRIEAKKRFNNLENRRRKNEADWAATHPDYNNTCTKDCAANDAKGPPQIYDNSILRLVIGGYDTCKKHSGLTQQNGELTVYCDIKQTFAMKSGEKLYPLVFTNKRSGASYRIRSVRNWALNGRQIWFVPEPTPQGFTWLFNRSFKKNDEIVVSYDDPRPWRCRDNAALTFVHGHDKKGTINRSTPTRIRYGLVAGKRDYTVFTVNVRRTVPQAYTFVERQYIITGPLREAQAQGLNYVQEHVQDNMPPGTHKRSHTVYLYKFPDKKAYGAGIPGIMGCGATTNGPRQKMCSGSTTPQNGFRAFFQVECLGSYYFGPNQYHFTPEPTADKVVRSYVCNNGDPATDKMVRPKWKLLGFFPEDACVEILGYKHDQKVCTNSEDDSTSSVTDTSSVADTSTSSVADEL